MGNIDSTNFEIEYPLTSYQKDIWLDQKMNMNSPSNNIGINIEIIGKFDYIKLNEAINCVISKNDAYRLQIREKNGEPYQCFLHEINYTLPYYDFCNIKMTKYDIKEWVQDRIEKTFDFNDILFDFALLKFSENIHYLFIKTHHIIADGWAFTQLTNKIVDVYNDTANNLQNSSFITLIKQDQKYLSSKMYKKDIDFWKEEFTIYPDPLYSYKDFNLSSDITSKRYKHIIPRLKYNKITELCVNNNVTEFHYFLAIISMYFCRIHNRDTIVIGVPLLNRSKKEMDIIGHCTNTIPLKIDISSSDNFIQLVRNIKLKLSKCYRHHKLSFGEIYRQLKLHETKLFDITLSFDKHDTQFNFKNTESFTEVLSHQHESEALFALIHAANVEDDAILYLDYLLEIFNSKFPIERVASHLDVIIENTLENKEVQIKDVEIMTPEENNLILNVFNATESDSLIDKTIIQLFEEQVERTPNNIAVVFEGVELTFKELNEKANIVGHYLQDNYNIVPDDLVGIVMNRSEKFLISILGIFKAGGAYVPVDPSYPEERIKYIFNSSNMKVSLFENSSFCSLDNSNTSLPVFLNEIFNNSINIANLEQNSGINDLAYVIYTSGSTGRPKGVMIEHAGMINHIHSMIDIFNVTAESRIAQNASQCFDISVWQFLTSLITGGRVYIYSNDTILNPEVFVNKINEDKISVLEVVPTYISVMLDFICEGNCLDDLEYCLVTGEELKKELVERWFDVYPNKKLVNSYGPAEASDDITHFIMDEVPENNIIPIGDPIQNLNIYIVDKNMKLCPVGIIGEIAVSGIGVGRGYLNNKEKTSETFIRDPFIEGEFVRLYKTGDLGCWLPDGNIEFHGRVDHQVKLKGFRIELGEIESNLLKHELITSTVVVAKEVRSETKELVAYYVSEEFIDITDLRQMLGKSLPDYMVPSCFIRVEVLPLTANGKVDRKALPEPEVSINTDVEYVSPRNNTEYILSKIWARVLAVNKPVGIDENFLELGGDSIKAIQIMSRLTQEGLKGEVSSLFSSPTIRELAPSLRYTTSIIDQSLITGKIPLSPIQKWFFNDFDCPKHHFNQAVMLELKENIDSNKLCALKESAAYLLKHHDALRMKYYGDGFVIQENRAEVELYFKEFDLSNVPNQEKKIEEIANGIQNSFDIHNDTLIRFVFFKLSKGGRFLIVAHHLVIDGVSWRILLEDLESGYRQFLNSGKLKLPLKTTSFKYWSETLIKYAESQEFHKDAQFWKGIDSKILPLPIKETNNIREKVSSKFSLSKEETEVLLTKSNQAFNTQINDILIASLYRTISKWSGETTLTIELESHGRSERFSDIDLSRTVGWFTSTYPVIITGGDINDIGKDIIRVKENLREIPDNGIGYGIYKYLVASDNNTVKVQNPEIHFNYLGQFDSDMDTELFGMATEPIGKCVSSESVNSYKLEFNGMVTSGQFTMFLDSDIYTQDTLDRVQKLFREELLNVTYFCKNISRTVKTASDFTLPELSQMEYKKLLVENNIDDYEVQDIYSMTPLQEGFMFHSMMDKDSTVYFEQISLEINGPIDRESFKKSWQELARRNDVLRTIFISDYKIPVQVVLKNSEIGFSYIDVREEEDINKCIEEIKRKDRSNTFDLKSVPLFRVKMIQFEDDKYIAVLCYHHILLDGWSTYILFSDFLQIYRSLVNSVELILDPSPAYSNYIKWLNKQIKDESLEYWKSYLSGYNKLATVPKDGGICNSCEYEQLKYSFVVDKNLTNIIKKLASDIGVTLNSVIQTVWGIILARYNGNDDVLFGVTVAGRPQEIPRIEEMVGLFINTIPVRIKADSNRSFRDVVTDVQQEAIESMNYHHTSLAQIQSDSGLNGSLLDHIIVFENYPIEESFKSDVSGIKVSNLDVFEQINYDFGITVIPSDRLDICLSYNPELYSEEGLKRIESHIRKTIDEVIHNSDILIKDIDIISADEKGLLVDAFNNTKADYPSDKTIIQLFEEQVKKTPDSIAVVFEGVELSYKELNEKANVVGHYLKDKYKIVPDDLVAVMLERSEKMVIALLGILKSGAAYVPIDPEYPEDRIGYMLCDSNPKTLITDSSILFDGAKETVNITNVLESGISKSNPRNITGSNNLAYVIYTSGTTGKPKGVMIEHKSVCNISKSWSEVYKLGQNKFNLLQIASFSFDVATGDIVRSLHNGGTLVIVQKENLLDFSSFYSILSENRISILEGTPKLLAPMFEYIHSNKLDFGFLETVIIGSDTLSTEDCKKVEFLLDESKVLINSYGVTEATIDSTYYLCKKNHKSYSGIIPIGKPLLNTDIYILNKNQSMLPIGSVGELYISGAGLARGYLNRPELTAEKFVDNPFVPNEKMYKTGDLARWLPDGNIEFLGRIDNQVKIRGVRIELGEVENSLMEHQDIDSAVVLVEEGECRDKFLVAYYVGKKAFKVSELRNILGKSLPDHMIPSYFIYLETLPLTLNGKVDRKALPKPDGTINTGTKYIAPRNEVQEKLVEIWKEVLGLENIGVRDNFFDLGGHSLKATRVLSKISKELSVKIRLKDIFEKSTIETLSCVIDKAKKIDFKEIELVEMQEFYKLSNAQRRLWIIDQLEDDNTAYNMATAFYLDGIFKEEIFNKSFSYLINRHESLRTVFIEDDGEPRQKILDELEYGINLVDFSEYEDIENSVKKFAKKELSTPFDLVNGPLIRSTILKVQDDKYLALFNMHHIISDGWSMNILTRDLLEAYNSYSNYEEPNMVPLRIQYKEYSAWQNDFLESPEVVKQRDYWLNKLSGEIPVLNLPADNVRPKMQSFNGNSIGFSIPGEINAGLNNLCKSYNVSLFMLLQAMVKTLLHRYTGQEDIILGSPIAGRVHEELENQIGLYLNTLVFRDNISSNLKFTELLENVKQTCTEAFDNQDYPFDRIVEDLNLDRDLSRSPLFDVMLILQNNETTEICFGGLDISGYETESSVSKFDMTIEFSEIGENLYCMIEYNTDIYNEDRVKRMGEHFQVLSTSVIENPESKIKDLEIISVDERNLLLNVFNDTKKDYPNDKTIIDFFEEQVEKTPNNVAVVFDGVELTYKKLNEKANIVAHYLRDHYAIVPDDLVGVLLTRSEKMIMTLLGILKSGAAYVPIDPDFPEDRIKYMLEDSSPKVVLSECDDYLHINRVFQSDCNVENPSKLVKTKNLAYVIYTSGSTGKPKGTLIEHGSLLNRLEWMQDSYAIGEEDTILQKTTFTFDVSVWEMFWWSINGAKLCLLKPGDEKDPVSIAESIKRNNVTTIHFVPSMYSAFLYYINSTDSISKVKSLKHIICSGEELTLTHLKNSEILIRENNTQLINLYGPTEATIDVTYYDCDLSDSSIPIGKPISNISLYIVDKNNNEQPIGIPGELCISGIGLARGYLNSPELTAEKFVDNPILTGERMYRTGDLARWLPDGNIEFLGRFDNQVKIRGYRIELGEIEKVLCQNENIGSCVVLEKESKNGDKFLVSYYVSDEELEAAKLRSLLSKSLPDYMVPSYFICLDEIPITSNGKIDRKALPEPKNGINTKAEYIEPRNEIEVKLVNIWEEVLGVEGVGVYDNFFNLGGHSLNGLKIINYINNTFQSNLRLKDLYTYATIEELSRIIKTSIDSDVLIELNHGLSIIDGLKQNLKENYDIDSILPNDWDDYYPLSKIQQGMVYLSQLKKDEPIYHDQFTYSLSFDSFNLNKFKKTLKVISDRHSIFRTSFNLDSFDQPYQVVHRNSRDELISFSDISLISRDIQESIIREYMESDLQDKFMKNNEFLWRLRVFDLGINNIFIVFSFHHAILDGWSVSTFHNELNNIYNQLESGGDVSKEAIKSDYKKYIAINLGRSESDTIKKFWKESLSNYIRTPLPFNYSKKKISKLSGSVIFNRVLNGDLVAKLEEKCIVFDCSIKELLLSAHIYLLGVLTGEKDIITGVVSHNRPEIEDTEKVLGCFLNSVPLRICVNVDVNKKQIVADVRDSLRRVKSNELFLSDIAAIVGDNDQDGNPLFDTIFNFTDFREIYSSDNKNRNSRTDNKIEIENNEMTNTFFDLEASIIDSGIEMQIKYSPLYFYPNNIETAYNIYLKILDKFIDNNSEIVRREVIEESVPQEIALDFNNTKVDYPRSKTITDMFEEQVERAPDNIALIMGDDKLTYNELNKKSNQLASLLIEKGVKPGDHIGITTERSFEMIIGMLGILKSGGVYIPIDPSYPEKRKKDIIENSDIRTIVQDKDHRLPCENCFLVHSSFEAGYSDVNPKIYKSPEDLAYVIYTSGSTGKPKGVMIKNHSITNLIYWINSRFNVKEDDRLLFITSMCFDLSVYDIFGLLAAGGSVVIATNEQIKNPKEAFKLLLDYRITFWDSVPSTFNFLIDEMIRSDEKYLQTDLRLVFMSGDWIPVNLPQKINNYFPNAQQISLGGATEGTVWSIYYVIDYNYDYLNSIPYGKPIGNNRFYILDDNYNSVPSGVPGELYIGGVGVAAGYMNDYSRSSASFIPDIFSDSKELMYRTGDYGRILPSGDIEFLGRKDSQVKVRGFRIELGEIENALILNEHIDSAVVATTELLNDKEIVAYYVSGKEFRFSELKSFIAKIVPDYMMPSYFIKLDKIPLTSNGKVDRLKLPKPDGNIKTEFGYVAPENEIQEELVEFLQDVLGLHKVGIFDNFFEIGGHSLSLLRFVQRIQAQYDIEFSDIIQNPTIEEISKIVKPKKEESIVKKLTEIKESLYNNSDIKHEKNDSQNELISYRNRFKRVYSDIDVKKTIEYTTLLLTGVTGYLGIHVLKELIQKGSANIFLIIRGDNYAHVKKRLSDKYMYYFNESIEQYNDRIHVLKGDLTKNYLGLIKEDYNKIASGVQCIINSAADVSHYGLYEDHYKSNVYSVENLLSLCEQGCNKYFVHISTTSVGGGYTENIDNSLFTEYHEEIGVISDNNYVRSKTEAEKRIFDSRKKGIKSTIFRVGNLVFQSDTGKFQQNIESNAFYQLLKSYIKLQMMPNTLSKDIELSYIDYVSKAIVLLFDKEELCNEVFHIYNHNTINFPDFAYSLNNIGYEIKLYDINEILEYFINHYDEPKYKEAIEVLLIHSHILENRGEVQFQITSEKTMYVLKKLGFEWGKIEMKHIEKMMEYGIDVGFFERAKIMQMT